jgi:hypothetical protein
MNTSINRLATQASGAATGNSGSLGVRIDVNGHAPESPPHNHDDEARLLGCVLLAPAQVMPLFQKVVGNPFYDQRHAKLFDVLQAMHRAGEEITDGSVYLKLRGEEWFNGTGGLGWLGSLTSQAVHEANAPAWFDSTASFHNRRRVLDLLAGGMTLAQDSDVDPMTLFADIGAGFEKLRQSCGYSSLPPIVRASDLADTVIEKPQELIAGLLHRGSKLALGGSSKSCKTWTLLDVGLSVASGKPWLGFPTVQGRVLLVNLEIQEAFIRQRLLAVAQAKDVSLDNLDVLNLRGFETDYSTLLPQIISHAKDLGYALIILDPIYKLFGAGMDENRAVDIAMMLRSIERLANETGAAVAFVAHFSKGNQAAKESIDRISGSGVFARDPDTLVMFTKHEEDHAFTVESTLRNFAPVEPFVVRWEYPLMKRDEGLDPAKLKSAGGRKPTVRSDAVLELLERPLTTTEWLRLAEQELGASKATFHRKLEELRQSERVLKSKVDGKWTRKVS